MSSQLLEKTAAAPLVAGARATARDAAVAVGLVGIAVIHLADLPGKMEEAPYIGWMYVALMAFCLVVAELLLTRPSRLLHLGAAAAAAATFTGFVLTRTTGLPGATDDIGNWTEPLGLISLLVEAVVVWWALRAATARGKA